MPDPDEQDDDDIPYDPLLDDMTTGMYQYMYIFVSGFVFVV